MSPEEAYSRCEVITRAEARNFSYGIRLLDPPRRRALSAVYAMARRIDDIGDGPQEPAEKLAILADVRASLAALSLEGEDPVLVALADASRRWPIPLDAFSELVEGCEMDSEGRRYETFEELLGYCRRVAGSVGRLSLGIFGFSRPAGAPELAEAPELADALGIALQLTNILRDVIEDRDRMGRVYLPSEDLRRFGVDQDLAGPADALAGVVLLHTLRARRYYAEGLRLLPLLDRRSRACTAAMAGIYRRVLRRIERRPEAVLGGRVALPSWEKGWVAVSSMAGAAAGLPVGGRR